MARIIKIEATPNLAGLYRINNIFDQVTGESLTLVDLIKQNGVVFTNELSHSFFEICQQLNVMGYRSTYSAEKANQYSIGYQSGTCGSIHIVHKDGELTIVDFEKKFGREFGDVDTNMTLLETAEECGRKSYTVGRDSFNEWLKMRFKCKGSMLHLNTCERLFREDYPVFFDEVVERAKESVSGYQVAKKGIYNNAYSYDICSSYPSQLLNDTPVGAPKVYESLEKVPSTYFYVVKFTALDVKIKPGKIDFLNIDGKGITTQCLTKHLFELFKRNYVAKTLKIKQIRGFKTRKGCFAEFVKKNVLDGKIKETNKVKSKYNKFVSNAIVGYMGRNTELEQTKLTTSGIKSKKISIEPVYLPLYLYVCGKAKAEFIEVLQRTHGVIYANTDGFITTEPANLLRLNIGRSGLVGAYEHKDTYKELYIETINGYTGVSIDGTIDNTLSGMRVDRLIGVEEYRTKSFKYKVTELTESGVAVRYISPQQ